MGKEMHINISHTSNAALVFDSFYSQKKVLKNKHFPLCIPIHLHREKLWKLWSYGFFYILLLDFSLYAFDVCKSSKTQTGISTGWKMKEELFFRFALFKANYMHIKMKS